MGLFALAALSTSSGTPRPHKIWRIASTVLVLIAIAATLLYFRPTISSLVEAHGGNQPADEVAAQMQRWVTLNWVRVTALAASIGMGLRGLFLPKS